MWVRRITTVKNTNSPVRPRYGNLKAKSRLRKAYFIMLWLWMCEQMEAVGAGSDIGVEAAVNVWKCIVYTLFT